MIWHPHPGQVVRIHYAKRYAASMPLHGKRGFIETVGTGPGPISVRLRLASGETVIVPRGNLVAEECGCGP